MLGGNAVPIQPNPPVPPGQNIALSGSGGAIVPTSLSGSAIPADTGTIRARKPNFWKWATISLIAIIIAFWGIYWFIITAPYCDTPTYYRIGSIDERFGLSEEDVLRVTKEAEAKWDQAAKRNMLEHDPEAELVIEFIYDERQARLELIKTKMAELDQSNSELQSLQERYDKLLEQYNADLKSYESNVDYWNSQGGAPSDIYAKLESERKSLNQRHDELREMLNLLNDKTSNYNQELDQLNGDTNQGDTKIEIEGEYDSNTNKISIYTYDTIDDLRYLLLHELGHVFSLNHATEPASVMYPISNADQNKKDPVITEEDLELIFYDCNLKR
ncbi:MAG: Matrixin [bacterium ADurb.Bin400]|nr:MAG: Matrixin [bacterium ADurb.Bin400]